MNQKLLDYEKVLRVIRSCRTSRQNQVAYQMCWRFQDMYKHDSYSLELFAVCDLNLNQIMGNYGGLPK